MTAVWERMTAVWESPPGHRGSGVSAHATSRGRYSRLSVRGTAPRCSQLLIASQPLISAAHPSNGVLYWPIDAIAPAFTSVARPARYARGRHPGSEHN